MLQRFVPASAIRTPTFVAPTGTEATEPALSHKTTPLPIVVPRTSGTVHVGKSTPLTLSLQPLSGAPVASSTKVAIAATGLTSGTPTGSAPLEVDFERTSTRA